MIEVIGWLGFVGLIVGYILNAKKNITCFYVWGLGNILMMIYAVMIDSNPQVATALVVLLMNVYGYIEWTKK
tara:strand:+ start:2229 stop:2444 length:216 start_codon:yes stop_codon:yes gene_type:complete